MRFQQRNMSTNCHFNPSQQQVWGDKCFCSTFQTKKGSAVDVTDRVPGHSNSFAPASSQIRLSLFFVCNPLGYAAKRGPQSEEVRTRCIPVVGANDLNEGHTAGTFLEPRLFEVSPSLLNLSH
jgi:hypothetical protein